MYVCGGVLVQYISECSIYIIWMLSFLLWLWVVGEKFWFLVYYMDVKFLVVAVGHR